MICCLILQIDERWESSIICEQKRLRVFVDHTKIQDWKVKISFCLIATKIEMWIELTKKKLLVLTVHLRWVVVTPKKPCRWFSQKMKPYHVESFVDWLTPTKSLQIVIAKKVSTSRVFLQIVVDYWSHQEFAKSCVDHHVKSLQILIDHNNDNKWSSRELSLLFCSNIERQWNQTWQRNLWFEYRYQLRMGFVILHSSLYKIVNQKDLTLWSTGCVCFFG